MTPLALLVFGAALGLALSTIVPGLGVGVAHVWTAYQERRRCAR